MQQPCHEEERSALLQFKHSFTIDASASKFQGAYPKVSSWKAQGKRRNCCEWDGIECDEKTGHVIGVDLSSSCLFGSTNSNSTLFRLVHLQRLNLADNHFNFSRIPTAIGRLSMLTSLNLSASMFSGQSQLKFQVCPSCFPLIYQSTIQMVLERGFWNLNIPISEA
ncbi:LRR domain containing protein [Parasponia andersonii]|uniref:LRR domain containing protein n=1 Tax=Parasponia andersonii TaxID=3476 RepID=A0A2P5CIJ3_PARAD|nr:LRR domain containing protein [Parasponia andersonii]